MRAHEGRVNVGRQVSLFWVSKGQVSRGRCVYLSTPLGLGGMLGAPLKLWVESSKVDKSDFIYVFTKSPTCWIWVCKLIHQQQNPRKWVLWWARDKVILICDPDIFLRRTWFLSSGYVATLTRNLTLSKLRLSVASRENHSLAGASNSCLRPVVWSNLGPAFVGAWWVQTSFATNHHLVSKILNFVNRRRKC